MHVSDFHDGFGFKIRVLSKRPTFENPTFCENFLADVKQTNQKRKLYDSGGSPDGTQKMTLAVLAAPPKHSFFDIVFDGPKPFIEQKAI